MRVSIIISFKQSDEDRKINLRGLLNYLKQLVSDDVELIVVEQDSHSRLAWLSDMDGKEQIKHIFIKNDDVFNKGLGYNTGVRFSSGDYLLFTDVDLYIAIEGYLGGLAFMPEYDVVKHYTDLHYLDMVNSRRFMIDYNTEGLRILQSIKPTVVSGGIFAIKRECFFALKGFDERCKGYGYEDDIFDIKMRKMGLREKFIQAGCVHVYHRSMRDGGNIKDKYYWFFKQNAALAHSYNKMLPSEVARTIRDTQTWGEANYEVITH